MDIAFVLIIVLTALFFVSIALYSFLLNRQKKILEYYHDMLQKIINNDSLIDESYATLATAYGIEEGDIRDFIVRRQDELTTNGK